MAGWLGTFVRSALVLACEERLRLVALLRGASDEARRQAAEACVDLLLPLLGKPEHADADAELREQIRELIEHVRQQMTPPELPPRPVKPSVWFDVSDDEGNDRDGRGGR